MLVSPHSHFPRAFVGVSIGACVNLPKARCLGGRYEADAVQGGEDGAHSQARCTLEVWNVFVGVRVWKRKREKQIFVHVFEVRGHNVDISAILVISESSEWLLTAIDQE